MHRNPVLDSTRPYRDLSHPIHQPFNTFQAPSKHLRKHVPRTSHSIPSCKNGAPDRYNETEQLQDPAELQFDEPLASVLRVPMTPPRKHTSQREVDLRARVDGRVPAIVADIPGSATTRHENTVLELGLQIGCPFALGRLFDLVCIDFATEDGADEFERVIDHVLAGEDDAAVTRGSVGSEDHEEIGEAVHGSAHIRLGTTSFGPGLVQRSAIAAGHVERVKPLIGIVSVGHDDHVGWNGARFRGYL